MSGDLVIHRAQEVAERVEFDADRLDLLRKTICPANITQPEFDLFVAICKRSGLDPFARQIYAIKRGAKMSVDTSIDGFRLLACRSGQYEGQVGPFWCGGDGKWSDVWLGSDPPMAAKVGVFRSGFREPAWGVALFNEFATFYNNQLSGTWAKLPTTMLAKCAESQALRKAFPAELSGLYTSDEMSQADAPTANVVGNGTHVDRSTGEIHSNGSQATSDDRGEYVPQGDPVQEAAEAEQAKRDAAEDKKREEEAITAAFAARMDSLSYTGSKRVLAKALSGKDKPTFADMKAALEMSNDAWNAAIMLLYAPTAEPAVVETTLTETEIKANENLERELATAGQSKATMGAMAR